MDQVLTVKLSGGSPHGLSSYRKAAGCPMKARLDAEAKLLGGPSSSDSFQTAVGSLFHAFQELYRSRKDGGFDTTVVEFVQADGDPAILDERARLEAERLFRAYRVKFKPKGLGTPVCIEEPLDFSDLKADRPSWIPPEMPLTARLDLVVKLGVVDCTRIRAQRGLTVSPGYYLVDFKTASSQHPGLADMYRDDVQFMVYQLLWNHAFPKRKLSGALVDITSKAKEPTFNLVYVPPVGEREEKIAGAGLRWIWDRLTLAQDIEETTGRIPVDTTQCYSWMEPCHWLREGRCARGADQ